MGVVEGHTEFVKQMHNMMERASRPCSWGYQAEYGRQADNSTDYFSRALGQEIMCYEYMNLEGYTPKKILTRILDSMINGLYEIKSALPEEEE